MTDPDLSRKVLRIPPAQWNGHGSKLRRRAKFNLLLVVTPSGPLPWGVRKSVFSTAIIAASANLTWRLIPNLAAVFDSGTRPNFRFAPLSLRLGIFYTWSADGFFAQFRFCACHWLPRFTLVVLIHKAFRFRQIDCGLFNRGERTACSKFSPKKRRLSLSISRIDTMGRLSSDTFPSSGSMPENRADNADLAQSLRAEAQRLSQLPRHSAMRSRAPTESPKPAQKRVAPRKGKLGKMAKPGVKKRAAKRKPMRDITNALSPDFIPQSKNAAASKKEPVLQAETMLKHLHSQRGAADQPNTTPLAAGCDVFGPTNKPASAREGSPESGIEDGERNEDVSTLHPKIDGKPSFTVVSELLRKTRMESGIGLSTGRNLEESKTSRDWAQLRDGRAAGAAPIRSSRDSRWRDSPNMEYRHPAGENAGWAFSEGFKSSSEESLTLDEDDDCQDRDIHGYSVEGGGSGCLQHLVDEMVSVIEAMKLEDARSAPGRKARDPYHESSTFVLQSRQRKLSMLLMRSSASLALNGQSKAAHSIGRRRARISDLEIGEMISRNGKRPRRIGEGTSKGMDGKKEWDTPSVSPSEGRS
ncbi:hypothetical protein DFH06DRAFT_1145398 [Mycena polygramma]|nr:hypothetical protein DFH06DRAFT_1145398 [Mycena polygramma]